MAFGIDGDAADLAEHPVVRQRLWPGGIDREGRDVAGSGRAGKCGDTDQRGGCENGGNGSGKTCNRTVLIVAIWHRYPPACLACGSPACREVNDSRSAKSMLR